MIELRVDNKNVELFLKEVKTNLKKHKFKLVLSIDRLKVGKNSVSGWFDECNKELVIGLNDPDWLPVLVHEYCHFLQFIENDETYTKANDEQNSLSNVWDWLDNNYEFDSEKDKDRAFREIIKMELNCEKRTIEKIKEYDLPIDLNEYETQAHIYLYYYLFAKKYRKWLGESYSTKDNDLFNHIPNKNLKGNFKKLSEEYEEIFKKFP